MVAPKSPSSRMRSTSGWGYSSACSYLLATGITSRSTNRRTVPSTWAVSAWRSSTAAPAIDEVHHVYRVSSTARLELHRPAHYRLCAHARDWYPADGRRRRLDRDGACLDASAGSGASKRRDRGVHRRGGDRPEGARPPPRPP